MGFKLGRSQPAGHVNDGEHHHHVNKHRIERFEGATDLIVVGLIVLLGLAMLIGLITASGEANW
jgi:hypothetical protein